MSYSIFTIECKCTKYFKTRKTGASTTLESFVGFFFDEGVKFKNFLGPTNVDNQLWFWIYNWFFLDLALYLGVFALVGPFINIFWGLG